MIIIRCDCHSRPALLPNRSMPVLTNVMDVLTHTVPLTQPLLNYTRVLEYCLVCREIAINYLLPCIRALFDNLGEWEEESAVFSNVSLSLSLSLYAFCLRVRLI